MTELARTTTTVASPRLGVRRLLLPAALAVVVVSVVGGIVAVSTGLSADLLAAMGPTGRLSVPIPMCVALVLLAVLAARPSRALAAVASALLGLASVACIVSGFFDGGYADSSLSGGQRANQAVLVAGLLALGAVAFARFAQVLRTPR